MSGTFERFFEEARAITAWGWKNGMIKKRDLGKEAEQERQDREKKPKVNYLRKVK